MALCDGRSPRRRGARDTPGVAVDVVSEIVIGRPPGEVAAYACDPDTATEWYENIKAVEWRSPPPLAVGTRLAFVAAFLGRRLEYTYEVRELVPGERFVMSTSEGPFPMETAYEFAAAGDGATRMRLRNRGAPSGFTKVGAPLMARAMRRANQNDLRRLKELLERRR
jgi:Polyketide cyclase / dehydrase and lipid transport